MSVCWHFWKKRLSMGKWMTGRFRVVLSKQRWRPLEVDHLRLVKLQLPQLMNRSKAVLRAPKKTKTTIGSQLRQFVPFWKLKNNSTRPWMKLVSVKFSTSSTQSGAKSCEKKTLPSKSDWQPKFKTYAGKSSPSRLSTRVSSCKRSKEPKKNLPSPTSKSTISV